MQHTSQRTPSGSRRLRTDHQHFAFYLASPRVRSSPFRSATLAPLAGQARRNKK
ncbi:MAG: hypothetical protein ACFB0B_21285 [Thermonemataceae bacterium]